VIPVDYFAKTEPMVHVLLEDLQGMHEDHDMDFLAVQWSEIPAPTAPIATVFPDPQGADAEPRESLLVRFLRWLSGPSPF
jgi:hypothetical protein